MLFVNKFEFTKKLEESTCRNFLAVNNDFSDNCVPSRILIDFERAAINDIKEAYPGSSISGCYFHLYQSFQREIAELGLKCFYERNANAALELKLIPALSFIPVAEVEKAFELVEEIFHVLDKLKADACTLEKTDQLTSSFQRTYIKGEQIRGNEKDVTFPIVLWNQNQETSEGLMRTTNAVERWYWSVSTLVQGSHPPIMTYLEEIRLDASYQKFNLLEATTGNVNRGRNKDCLLDRKFQQGLADYNADNPINFLISISHLTS